ncbi:MAG TPA: nicotinamide mononucleotide transporter, partial [Ferruginibacter sp.]|nr:nicotinamide mononucleotide transporter [Ferruginibacter sp.]
VVRIGYSSGKASQIQLAGFGIAYLLLFVAFRMADHYFTTGIIPWIDAFFFAALLTAAGTMCFKRMECWYWIAGTCAAGVASYLMKHYLFNSCYYALLLTVSVWAVFKWKKRMTRVRV